MGGFSWRCSSTLCHRQQDFAYSQGQRLSPGPSRGHLPLDQEGRLNPQALGKKSKIRIPSSFASWWKVVFVVWLVITRPKVFCLPLGDTTQAPLLPWSHNFY